MMNNLADIVLLHGWNGCTTKGWFSDLVQYLEENNINTLALDFPNTENPKYHEWKSFF